MVQSIVLFAVAVAVVLLILKYVGKSIKLIAGVLVNALVGLIVLVILSKFGLNVDINWASALIVGFLGIPGVIIVLVLQLVFGWLIF